MIEQLVRPVAGADIHDLAALLLDAIDTGASVSFLAPFDMDRAEGWWHHAIATVGERSIFLVARDSQGILGTVQLHAACAPNQQHRGEIAKLLVHRCARRQRVGTALMELRVREICLR